MIDVTRKQRLKGLIVAGLVLVGGCARAVREPEPPVEVPASFSASGPAPLQVKWWKAFEDEELNVLIEQALTGNLTLQTAWDRLAQAQAVAEQAAAILWPQADVQAGAGRTRTENERGTTYSTLYSVGVAAAYEVDLWSRLRSTRRAAWLDVQAGRDAVDTAALTVAAAIANTWYQLAEAKALLQIANEQIETNTKVLDIVTVQFRKGKAAAADVLRQRQLVASTEAQALLAEETVHLLQYTLSVLLGKRPELGWQQTTIPLPELPPQPALGVPTEVLWRRPDVRQAYRAVQAADQRLGAAVADQYPRLSLSASADTSAPSVHNLFDDWLANLAANAVQPLFDADRRKAEVKRQKAVVSQSIHNWSQTILDALEDVEAALTQERQQRKLVENTELRLRLARGTYERIRETFIKGQVDYIRVLESLQSLQRLQRDLITARRRLVQFRIDLYRSIAGGFELPQPLLAQVDPQKQKELKNKDVVEDE
jgi:NodT family efflux transporter outer membrane factor (OMF) lipoprotein